MFSDELEKISWEETTARINAKTEADVRRALSKEHCDVDDFMALVSPAAAPYLETMARLSRKYTEERFGKTMSMFIPLYITNSCTNSCVYCGFHISNPMRRTILTEEEIENEYKAIKKLAPFENLLIVTGENPAKAGVPYLARALDLAKPYFSNLKIEVMPLKTEGTRDERSHLLSGNVPQGELQHLPSSGHEVEIRVACQRFRPHGTGRGAFHRDGSPHWPGERMAYGHYDDGLSFTLFAEALLADEIQCELPPYAALRERRLPTECRHERP